MDEPIKVLVVDDHSLFRCGLVALLNSDKEIEVVGQAPDGAESIRLTEELNPDIILMDIQMPGCSGLETTHSIREKGFSGGILMLTISDKDDDLFAAIKAGANGYLLKNAELEELSRAITHVANHEAIISPIMATKLLGEFNSLAQKKAQQKEPGTALSQREGEILKLVAEGASNREIASTLFISENTVKTHLRNIMGKLHLKNRYQAVAYAAKRGLIPVPEEL